MSGPLLTLPGIRPPTPVADPSGAIYTPDSLALAIARHVAPLASPAGTAVRVLEPSVGGGAFVRAARQVWPGASASITTGVDADPSAAGLSMVELPKVGDWPEVARSLTGPRFDVCLMNPPFGDAVGMAVTVAHVRAAIEASNLTACILPCPYLTGAEFHDGAGKRHGGVLAKHPPARVLRVVDRPWPAVLREVLVFVWCRRLGELDDTFLVETLDWRRS